jgi:hypothetical protein
MWMATGACQKTTSWRLSVRPATQRHVVIRGASVRSVTSSPYVSLDALVERLTRCSGEMRALSFGGNNQRGKAMSLKHV